MSTIKDDLTTIFLVEMDDFDLNGIYWYRSICTEDSGLGLKERYIEPHRLAKLWWDDETYYKRVDNAHRLLKNQMIVKRASGQYEIPRPNGTT